MQNTHEYRSDIDGLRGVAVGAVVLFHGFPNIFPAGFIGVDVFFVISGYLITTIITRDIDKAQFKFVHFYARRIKRLFPALLLVLITTYIIGWFILFAGEYKQLGKHIFGGASFSSNILLLRENGYFDQSAETKPLLHLWSLSVEEQFYIAFPIIFYVIATRKHHLLFYSILAAIGGCFFLNLILSYNTNGTSFYFPLSRFWELLIGSLLSLLVVKKQKEFLQKNIQKKLNKPNNSRLHLWFPSDLMGAALLVIGFSFISKSLYYPGWVALIPSVATFLIIFAGPNALINRSVLSYPALVWLGRISYPLYLWHWPLLTLGRLNSNGNLSLFFTACLLTVSILLSWLTYKFVETPIRAERDRSKGREKALILCMVIVGFVGLVTYFFDGFYFRTQKNEQNSEQLSYTTFPTTSRCVEQHPYAVASCYQSTVNHAQTVYLIGDSHMEALTYGFKQLFDIGGFPFNIVAIGHPGCAPFINTESITNLGVPFGCEKVISSALKDAASRPDVQWVVLVGRHASRLSGVGFGVAEEEEIARPWTYRFTNEHLKTNDLKETFSVGLNETLKFLDSSGKKILFVHQLPELGFDPRNCLARRSLFQVERICRIERTSVNDRLNPYKEIVGQALSFYANSASYDPLSLVCNEIFCSPFNDQGELMYRDDDHMSKLAAFQIATKIKEIITPQP